MTFKPFAPISLELLRALYNPRVMQRPEETRHSSKSLL